MIFFKDNAPHIEDYDKTQSVLIELGWLQKIYNVEMNRSVYDTTSLGYQYYFAICMKTGYAEMFGGPRLQEGQLKAHISESIDLVEEGYIIDGIDSAKLTPLGAEYLYVLTDSQPKSFLKGLRMQKSEKKSGKSNMSKVLGGVQTFMKGMHEMSKMAQKYDKASTDSTKNVWSATRKRTKKPVYSRKSPSVSKGKKRFRKKYRKR